jgi:hypothetical protein
MDPRFIESGASSYVSPEAGEKTKTIKTGAGKLFYMRIANTTSSKVYAWLFDDVSAADNKTILCPPIPVAANSDAVLFPYPLGFTTNLIVSSSSTQTSYTAGGNNDLQIHAVYK